MPITAEAQRARIGVLLNRLYSEGFFGQVHISMASGNVTQVKVERTLKVEELDDEEETQGSQDVLQKDQQDPP